MLGVTITTRFTCSALWSCAISSGRASSGVYTRPANIGNSFVSPWMCVWQSQAFAGTSKFTGVLGWDGFANTDPGIAAVAAVAIRTSRRVGMAVSLGSWLCGCGRVVAPFWHHAGRPGRRLEARVDAEAGYPYEVVAAK